MALFDCEPLVVRPFDPLEARFGGTVLVFTHRGRWKKAQFVRQLDSGRVQTTLRDRGDDTKDPHHVRLVGEPNDPQQLARDLLDRIRMQEALKDGTPTFTQSRLSRMLHRAVAYWRKK